MNSWISFCSFMRLTEDLTPAEQFLEHLHAFIQGQAGGRPRRRGQRGSRSVLECGDPNRRFEAKGVTCNPTTGPA
ncbi:MAG: hypothetical protein H7A46_16320 [Verrucomicrobiales bacterium]|nr:hypothetical protein [Verrucomicrobiales bacterium]